jgi:hypothetical protein
MMAGLLAHSTLLPEWCCCSRQQIFVSLGRFLCLFVRKTFYCRRRVISTDAKAAVAASAVALLLLLLLLLLLQLLLRLLLRLSLLLLQLSLLLRLLLQLLLSLLMFLR